MALYPPNMEQDSLYYIDPEIREMFRRGQNYKKIVDEYVFIKFNDIINLINCIFNSNAFDSSTISQLRQKAAIGDLFVLVSHIDGIALSLKKYNISMYLADFEGIYEIIRQLEPKQFNITHINKIKAGINPDIFNRINKIIFKD